MGNVLGTPFSGGNRITTLVNGDQIFPAMLRAIRGAEKSVTFETFVFKKGEIPQQFVDALAERARAGVKVHVILDAVGASKSRGYHRTLREAGVELERFHHIFYWDLRRFNYRTHRKLLVVDGKIGFTGGVGIADEWAGNADSPEHWRDCHYQIEGPVVAQLQGAFEANWLKTRGELLAGPAYFPALSSAGPVEANSFYSAPRRGRVAVSLMYQMAIHAARQSLCIENPYFVPDKDILQALAEAARRGVKVQLILPGRHIDSKAVRHASRKRWPKLLAAGVEIYEYQPTMIHSKLMIVDGLFASVGSANLDSRSLAINDEANLNVLNADFAAEQNKLFANDLAQSVRVTVENLKKQSLIERPLEPLERPLDKQL
jgi:cardiolipin synthase